jgi:glycosyltransferase involved in cell wall biosynthesis
MRAILGKKVTVIVPVYGAENYINRCIDSVIHQTFEEWELVLIDDGSPDRCGEICDAYAKKDHRIRVIHQKNIGVSATRNKGLDEVDTEYFYFLDSDDYLPDNALETLYSMAQTEDADIVVGGHSRVEPDGYIHCDSDRWPDLKTTEDIQLAILRNQIPNFSCAKLFKRKLWDGIRYPVGQVMEDLYTAPHVFYRAKKIAITKDSLYFYSHENKGSIMSNGGAKYIRLKYGQFLAWREHELVAEGKCPRYIDECAKKAVHAAVRAYMLNYGIEELSYYENAEIVKYLRAHRTIKTKCFISLGRLLILSHSSLLLPMGYIQRGLVNNQQKRRLNKNKGR